MVIVLITIYYFRIHTFLPCKKMFFMKSEKQEEEEHSMVGLLTVDSPLRARMDICLVHVYRTIVHVPTESPIL